MNGSPEGYSLKVEVYGALNKVNPVGGDDGQDKEEPVINGNK